MSVGSVNTGIRTLDAAMVKTEEVVDRSIANLTEQWNAQNNLAADNAELTADINAYKVAPDGEHQLQAIDTFDGHVADRDVKMAALQAAITALGGPVLT